MSRLMKMASTAAGAATLVGAGALVAVQPAQAAARPAACTASQLATSIHDEGGAGGHELLVLVFVNKSHTTCQMTGYPGVAGLDAHNRQVIQARRTTAGYLQWHPARVRPVVVKPGRWATAGVEWIGHSYGGSGRGATLDALLVTPPNTRTPVRVSLTGNLHGMTVYPDFAVHPTVY